MSTIVSSLIFTRKDIAGNPHVEGYFLVEFRDAGYTPGGENVNLSPYMRRVEFIQAQPVSGILDYEPRPSHTDYPGNAGSGRMTLHYLTSMIVTVHMSGLGVSVLMSGIGVSVLMSGIGLQVTSGQTFTVSGVLPLVSGLLAGAASGRILFATSGLTLGVTSGSVAPGQIRTELLSGVAVSGTRAVIHALGV